jgi:hypothetical protein
MNPPESQRHAHFRDEVAGRDNEDIEGDTANSNGGLEVGREGGDHAEEAGEVESGGVDEEDVDGEVGEGGLRRGELEYSGQDRKGTRRT